MRRAAAITLFVLMAGGLVSPAAAQPTAALYSFELATQGSTTAGIIPGGGPVDFVVLFSDKSRDSVGSQVPNGPSASPYTHQTRYDFILGAESTVGWAVTTPSIQYTRGGDEREVTFTVVASLLIQTPVMPVTLQAITSAGGSRHVVEANVTIFSLGVESFSAQPQDIGGEVKPDRIVDVPIRITNSALVPRGFDVEVTSNPCGLQVATSGNNLVAPKATETVTVSTRTPNNKLWYFSQNCELGLQVAPTDAPSAGKSLTANIVVNGGYIDPVWVFWVVAIILFIVLLIFFLARRKERIEEELLGKPQKPWTIPVEALYLRALRQKDERAWYVVRHHLMEEEYSSALLWYKSYKKATKGSRKKEAVVLRQEHAYESWKGKWQKRIAKPLKEADRFEAKLQRKLDRKARKEDRKDARSVRKLTKKMSAAHAKQVERGLEKWQKQVAKANKKGIEAPPRPVLPEPDYPDEPEPRSYVLAEHKWAKKAARFRARRVREQGNLEVRFEKADARQLAKVRRKVQRLARKLDDPDFVAEHPLLRTEA